MLRTIVFLTALLAGCHGTAHRSDAAAAGVAPPAEGISDAMRVKVLAEADWNRMQSVTLELRDYGSKPREMRFKADQPYRLTIHNSGSVNHYFNAADFLRNVATRKAQVPNYAEMKAPFFTSFEVMRRGGTMELYFIPVTRGSYRAHCHLEGKEHEGVESTLIVE
jgi:uncharacterized cupredoxin-like copper-binding protein